MFLKGHLETTFVPRREKTLIMPDGKKNIFASVKI